MTGTLRDDATRVACLKALRDAIDTELQGDRAHVTEGLSKAHAEFGFKQLEVMLPDGRVIAKASYQPPAEKPQIVDQAAMTRWVAERYPSEVTETVRDAFADQLKDRLEVFDGKVIDTGTGEPVDWAQPRLKPANHRMSFETGGKAAVAAAWRDRNLDGVFGGALAIEEAPDA